MDLLSDGLRALQQNLYSIPSVAIEEIAPGRQDSPDIALRVSLPGTAQIIWADVKSSGQPRYARQVGNRFFRVRSQYPEIYGVFIAPYISPPSAAICVQAGIGYVDLSGNCCLAFHNVFILRALLTYPKQVWTTTALSNAANVSMGMVSHIKKLLADREWILLMESGFQLIAPFDLLGTWAEHYSFRKNKLYDFYSLKDSYEFESDLSNACSSAGIPYALTGFSASARLAPAVRFQRAMAYVQGDIPALAAGIGLKSVSSGPNVTLLSPYDEGVFSGSKPIDDIVVANPIQVYLDLKNYRGRGEEAAETLLNQVIKPQW
jgi:Transcriptional regulator, AbiEi antitoxin, Type IV TA system